MSESVIQIDEQAEIQKIIRQLNTLPNQLKAPGVLASAINATANEMKRKIGQRTRKRYAISDKKILTDRKQGGMYLERATGTSTEATLISMGGMVEVMAYMTRRNTETTAAMLKVLNESSFVGLGEKGVQKHLLLHSRADTRPLYSVCRVSSTQEAEQNARKNMAPKQI